MIKFIKYGLQPDYMTNMNNKKTSTVQSSNNR